MPMRDLWAALRGYMTLAILVGGLYSALVWGFAHTFFPHRAQGSLVTLDGRIIGSALIGQEFSGPDWFDSRPSATHPPYNAAASGPSNFGPTSPQLLAEVRSNLRRFPNVSPALVPTDLLESSGSGLDPDISVAAALFQVPRVARARHLPAATLTALVERQVQGRWLGLYGEPRVNVLALNLALQRLAREEAGRAT